MNDLDLLLSIVENPTRRRILEMLSTGPQYPLQLSKMLGVSQQAVMKNLALMEECGIVSSHREDSNMGPQRTMYQPNAEFTLVVDMRGSMFSAKVVSPRQSGVRIPDTGVESIIERISDIDAELARMDEIRSKLLDERNRLIAAIMDALPDTLGYEDRREIHERLTTGRAGSPSNKE
ncbi:MAG: ArsR family transcriptional regulator [Candidatus Methanomethylophilaceae archaeon]|nr:ArsR family transcriptional regulator [Candidatus Methanomethylophilaceae archaeon]